MSIIYTTPAIIEQRKALARRLIEVDSELAQRLMGRIGQQLYSLAEAGERYDRVWAKDAEAALQIARDRFDAANYEDMNGTDWIDIRADNVLDRCDGASETITVEPEEPDCEDGREHDWQSPYEVLGGLKENPGVHGHGGGVVMRYVCSHCGRYRVVDTWAQRMDTGEQGLTSVEYLDADDDSREWLRSIARS